MNEKVINKLVVAGLLLLGVGIIGFKIYLITPRFVSYESKGLGFTVQIPSYWGSKYKIVEKENPPLVLFMYQPIKGEPQIIFAIAKVTSAEWQAISNDRLKRPVSRKLAEAGDSVYYAYWLANNPYSGGEASIYLAMVRDISQVLNSFQLRKTTTSSQPEFCIQVITPAKNPVTGEIKDFSTPCAVPDGWEIIRP